MSDDRIQPDLTGGATNLDVTGSILDFVSPELLRLIIDMRNELYGDADQVLHRDLRAKAELRTYDVTVRQSKTINGTMRVAAKDEKAARLAAVSEYRRINGLAASVHLMATSCEEATS